METLETFIVLLLSLIQIHPSFGEKFQYPVTTVHFDGFVGVLVIKHCSSPIFVGKIEIGWASHSPDVSFERVMCIEMMNNQNYGNFYYMIYKEGFPWVTFGVAEDWPVNDKKEGVKVFNEHYENHSNLVLNSVFISGLPKPKTFTVYVRKELYKIQDYPDAECLEISYLKIRTIESGVLKEFLTPREPKPLTKEQCDKALLVVCK